MTMVVFYTPFSIIDTRYLVSIFLCSCQFQPLTYSVMLLFLVDAARSEYKGYETRNAAGSRRPDFLLLVCKEYILQVKYRPTKKNQP